MNDAVRTRELNDTARTTFVGCRVMVTPGVRALNQLYTVMRQVQSFDTFGEDNDPYGEHDFGSFELAGETLFWKFDYYNPTMTGASLDPTNPSVTMRALTIMLASEY